MNSMRSIRPNRAIRLLRKTMAHAATTTVSAICAHLTVPSLCLRFDRFCRFARSGVMFEFGVDLSTASSDRERQAWKVVESALQHALVGLLSLLAGERVSANRIRCAELSEIS